MVRMVVVGARGNHDVGFPLPYGADDLAARFERGHQLAIVVVEDLVLGDAEAARRLLRLQIPAPGQGAASHRLVAGVAVGDGEELDGVAGSGELDGRAAELDVAIVRVGADGEDAQLGRRTLSEGQSAAQESGCE